MHLRVLGELGNFTARQFSLSSLQDHGNLWSSLVSEKKVKMKPIFKGQEENLGHYRLVILTSFFGKVMMQILRSFFEPPEGDWEQPAWSYQGQPVPDPPDSIL